MTTIGSSLYVPAPGDRTDLVELTQLPPGLVNVGNSCYINSILQALASSRLFCKHVTERAAAVQYGSARAQEAEAVLLEAAWLQQQLGPWGRLGRLRPQQQSHPSGLVPPAQTQAAGEEDDQALPVQEEQIPGCTQQEGNEHQRQGQQHQMSGLRPASRLGSPSPFAYPSVPWLVAVEEAAAEAITALVSGLVRTALWIQGWDPPEPSRSPAPPPPIHLVASSAITPFLPYVSYTIRGGSRYALRNRRRCRYLAANTPSAQLSQLAAGRLLVQLDATLAALQPRYGTVVARSDRTSRTAHSGGDGGKGPVDPSGLLTALRGHLEGETLEAGRQNDAAEALTCLCDALESELAAWHMMFGRWLQNPPYGGRLLTPGPEPQRAAAEDGGGTGLAVNVNGFDEAGVNGRTHASVSDGAPVDAAASGSDEASGGDGGGGGEAGPSSCDGTAGSQRDGSGSGACAGGGVGGGCVGPRCCGGEQLAPGCGRPTDDVGGGGGGGGGGGQGGGDGRSGELGSGQGPGSQGQGSGGGGNGDTDTGATSCGILTGIMEPDVPFEDYGRHRCDDSYASPCAGLVLTTYRPVVSGPINQPSSSVSASSFFAAAASCPAVPLRSPLRGLLRTTTTCTRCGGMSVTQTEPFWSLQLPMPPLQPDATNTPPNQPLGRSNHHDQQGPQPRRQLQPLSQSRVQLQQLRHLQWRMGLPSSPGPHDTAASSSASEAGAAAGTASGEAAGGWAAAGSRATAAVGPHACGSGEAAAAEGGGGGNSLPRQQLGEQGQRQRVIEQQAARPGMGALELGGCLRRAFKPDEVQGFACARCSLAAALARLRIVQAAHRAPASSSSATPNPGDSDVTRQCNKHDHHHNRPGTPPPPPPRPSPPSSEPQHQHHQQEGQQHQGPPPQLQPQSSPSPSFHRHRHGAESPLSATPQGAKGDVLRSQEEARGVHGSGSRLTRGSVATAAVARLEGLLAAPHLPDLDLEVELAAAGAALAELERRKEQEGEDDILVITEEDTHATWTTAGDGGSSPLVGAPGGRQPPLPPPRASSLPKPPPPLPMVRTRAVRQSGVVSWPGVVVVQLARTVWDPRVGGPAKDSRHVAFPLELTGEELEELGHNGPGASAEGSLQEETCARSSYDLIAVIVHYGGAESGHYLVYRRIPAAEVAPEARKGSVAKTRGDIWLRVSDSCVSAASEEVVLAQPAALLVYEQVWDQR